jgi:hypothetical protein
MSVIEALTKWEVDVEPTRLRFPRAGRIAVELSVRLVDPESGSSPICPHCDSALNLHQPDETSPEQLLATCDTCFRWFCLVELGTESVDVLMIELPGKSMIEKALSRDAVDQR